MRGAAFKAWREGAGMTQDEAAAKAGVSRKTVMRAEAAGDIDVAFKLAEIALPELTPEPAAKPAGKRAPGSRAARAAQVVEKVRAPIEVSPALKAAMLRNPPFAKTSAEAKAMRELRAQQRGIDLSHIRLLPLRPDWTRLDGGRLVNGAIPEPLAKEPPAWAGDRGVLTASGAVYDYESAHLMRPPHEHGAAQVTAGDW